MITIAPVSHRSGIRTVLLAFFALPLLAFGGFFWIEIPDSHIWQLALSLLVALLLAGAFLWIVSACVRSIRRPALPCSHWLGASLLAFWLLLKWLLVHFISRIDDHAMQRAGFWNSKLSADMRTTFTFDRMIAWQHDVVLLLLWIILPALITPFFVETVSRGLRHEVWRTATAVLRRWQHWIVILVCDAAVYLVTTKLTGWRPSHSVHGELISLAVRLVLCYAADFALIICFFSVESKLLAREYARRYPTAEPVADAA